MNLRGLLGLVVRGAGMLAAVCIVGGLVPALAAAARNGLLVVQPRHGGGLVLMAADGSAKRLICTDRAICGVPRNPVWSSSGRLIAFSMGGALAVIYPDGTCLNCGFRPDPIDRWTFGRPGFRADGSLGFDRFSPGASYQGIYSTMLDGVGLTPVLGGEAHYRSPAWSPKGRMAVVRNGAVFISDRAGRRLQRVARHGDWPTWSPTGERLAIASRGRIAVIDLHGRVPRTLGRGRAPAWSPDGRQIAFVGDNGRILIAPSGRGRVHAVPGVRGIHVSWQPLVDPVPRCDDAPPGSTIVASSASAVITTQDGPNGEPSGAYAVAYLGCLRSTGEERLIYSFPPDERKSSTEDRFVLAGDYAAFRSSVGDQYGTDERVITVDLRTGASVYQDDLGESYIGGPPAPTLKALLLSAGGVPVWKTSLVSADATTETIVAHERTGLVTLDSETVGSDAAPSAGLANLSIVDNQVTWTHDGQPRSRSLNG